MRALQSTGGYNGMHVTALGPIIESVEHLRELRPEVYPREKYPDLTQSRRYHNVFDFCMDTVTIDRTFPQIGDTGSYPQYRPLPRITFHSADFAAFEHAWRVFRDPKFAWALARHPNWRPSAEFGFTREEIEAAAATWPMTGTTPVASPMATASPSPAEGRVTTSARCGCTTATRAGMCRTI